jgi:quercetin dioxygenase-like cupin family protein
MTNIEEQTIPAAYSCEVNVDSTLKYMGEVITLLAKATETNGRFAFMEVKVRPGTEPPHHIHHREHELFFVLEGAIRFYTPETTFDVQVGGVAFLPQGEPHTFACLTKEIRALLLAAASGEQRVGMDGYFLATGEPARDMVVPDGETSNAVDDPEQAIKIGASWGIRFLTPEGTKRALPLYPDPIKTSPHWDCQCKEIRHVGDKTPAKHSLLNGQLGALASLLHLLELSTHFKNEATLLGCVPVIRSPHKLGEASATAQLLIGAAGAAIWTARTGEKTDIEIDIIDALHFLHPTHFVSQAGHSINVGAEFVELNGVFRCKDGGYVMIEAGPPYPKLLKGYLDFFDCGNNKESISREIAKWNAKDLEDALAAAGLPCCRAFSREDWLGQPQGSMLSQAPVIQIEKIANGPRVPFAGRVLPSKTFGCWTSPMCWQGPGAHVRSLNMELTCCTSVRRLIPTHWRNTSESISANDAPIWTFGT